MFYVNARMLKAYGRKIGADTVLCKEGDPGQHMFIIYSGKVRISKNIEGADTTLVVLEDGAFFGEMSIILNEPRTATATTTVDSEILIIDATGFEAMVRKSPDMALRIINTLAGRLKATNNTLAILIHPDHLTRIILYIEDLAMKSQTEVEDGFQITLNFKEMENVLNVNDKQIAEVMEKLKRSSLCYKLRKNYYVVTDRAKIRKFLKFLKKS